MNFFNFLITDLLFTTFSLTERSYKLIHLIKIEVKEEVV